MIVHAYYLYGETRVQREAEALINAGHEVDIICLRAANQSAFEIIGGAKVHRLSVKRYKQSGAVVQLFEYLLFFTLVLFKLTRLHWQRCYNVVQVHNLPDFLVFATLPVKLMGVPVILDLHDLMPEFFAARFNISRNSFPVRLVQRQEQLSCRFADHVITVSEYWRQSLVKRGVPAHKCSVVMNLADDRIFRRPNGAQPQSAVDDRFCLFYHGTITKRYGMDLLVQAVNLLRSEIPTIDLTILGAGEYKETLSQLVQTLNLTDHVHVNGGVSPEQLPSLITAADLAVVPYTNDTFTDELVPTKLIEYAALGVPAIAARTTAIACYFDETMVQFFTPGNVNELAQAILSLYQDRAHLAELAVAIQKFTQRYNWATHKLEYIKLVEQLADKLK